VLRTFMLAMVVGLIAIGCTGKKSESEGKETPIATSGPTQVEFEAKDGTRVYADLYMTEAGKDAPIILLFHQARANAAEYSPIAPRLAKEGFNCLAVDLRSGGTAWQRKNRTAEQFDQEQSYESAFADMVAALEWAKTEGYGKIIAFGSSYSASLAFRLAAENQEIREVIAFSPGEYFQQKGIVAQWASQVAVPVFVSCAPSEIAETEKIFDAIATEEKSFHTPEQGLHGASALRADKNAEGAEAIWKALLEFLAGVEEGPEPEPEPIPEG